jgi:hypothetical protein
VRSDSLWITGSAKSGKTETLVAQLEQWVDGEIAPATPPSATKACLVFAVNAENRRALVQRLGPALSSRQGSSLRSTTPIGFFESEVLLFWPLIIEQLDLRGYFPFRLRPEAEQDLALRFWNGAEISTLQSFEPGPDQWVGRILDLIQLAASSGVPLDQLAAKLSAGDESIRLPPDVAELVQQMALNWKDWCLQRGILTYGLVIDLFNQSLLKHDAYLNQISQRFSAVAADDIDNYPAIAKGLFERCLDLGLPGLFTYSPTGGIRKGLGADPDVFLSLRDRCTEIVLRDGYGLETIDANEGGLNLALPDRVELYRLQTVSRTQLLEEVAQQIVTAVQSSSVRPQDIALIGPGLDPIARYTLLERLQRQGIPVEPLHEQRSLQSSALVRSLLTLLALVYPGLGHWVETEQIAEMLSVLTGPSPASPADSKTSADSSVGGSIDPVRAGLLADYCFRPHPEHPELLPIESYLRWDRLGHSAAQAYERIRQWILQQRGAIVPAQQEGSLAYLTLSPMFILDRAIQTFLVQRTLQIDQISTLRQLIETAQHYWEVDTRLRRTERDWPTLPETVANFILLLRRGVITANPYPVATPQRSALVLANSFQYLNARLQHPWQFWLDAGSQLWQYGGEVDLWGASLFLSQPAPPMSLDRMNATLSELVRRAQSRIYLCHSELAVSGQAQFGPLLPWIEAAIPCPSVDDSGD